VWVLLFGIFAVGVAGVNFAGWLFNLPYLLLPQPHGIATVLSAAICLLLCGLALLICDLSPESSPTVATAIGGVVGLIALLSVVEQIAHHDLGADLPRLHAAVISSSHSPGRMPLNLALAFVCAAASMYLITRPADRKPSTLIHVLLAIESLLGFAGLWACWHDQQWFLEQQAWLDFFRMSPSTAIALLLLAAGGWKLARLEAAKPQSEREALTRRTYLRASLVVAATALIISLAGVALLQSLVISSARTNLSQAVLDRRLLMQRTLTGTMRRAESAVDPSIFSAAVRAFNTNPNDGRATAQLLIASQTLTMRGFPAVAIQGADRGFLAIGAFMSQTGAQISVDGASPFTVVWADGYKLDIGIPVNDAAGLAGLIVIQQPLDWGDEPGSENGAWENQARTALCGRDARGISCIPSEVVPEAYNLTQPSGAPLEPIGLATQDNEGSAVGFDREGQRVLTAYGPVGQTDLGLVVEWRVSSLFAQARQRLKIAEALVVSLLIVTLWLLHRQISSLGTRAGVVAATAAATVVKTDPVAAIVEQPLHSPASELAPKAQAAASIDLRHEKPVDVFENFLEVATSNGAHGAKSEPAAGVLVLREAEPEKPLLGRADEPPPAYPQNTTHSNLSLPSEEKQLPNPPIVSPEPAKGVPPVPPASEPVEPQAGLSGEPSRSAEPAPPPVTLPLQPSPNHQPRNQVKISRLVVFLTLTGAFAAGVALTTGVFSKNDENGSTS
jgi:hypothetical protein